MKNDNAATPAELDAANATLKRGWNLTTRQIAVLAAPSPLDACAADRSIARRLRLAGVKPATRGTRGAQSRWSPAALVALGVVSGETLVEEVA